MADEVLGHILRFIPSEYRTKVLKSAKEFPEIELLFKEYDLSDNTSTRYESQKNSFDKF